MAAGRLKAVRIVQRNMLVNRHGWIVIFSGFFEPVFYLFGLGLGLGSIVGDVMVGGRTVSYAVFVAPALLATSCMNGAITEGCFNVFFKLHRRGTYEGILATPLGVADVALGEMAWALIRGTLYAAAFIVIISLMGFSLSLWALLALPAAVLVSAAFAGFAIMLTSFMTEINHFERVMNLVVLPMFLFSGTFFPLSVYPASLRAVVQLLPLYHATALLRALTTGSVGPDSLTHVVYLLVMMAASIWIAARRLQRRIVV
ncbi:MAG: ABC transporter permease [Actinomycetota bacterium]